MARSPYYGGQGRSGSLNPCGYQQVTLSGLTALTPAGENIERVLIRVAGGACRWRDDRVNPTASTGMPLLQDEVLILDSGFTDIRFIKDSTAVGTVLLDVNWYN